MQNTEFKKRTSRRSRISIMRILGWWLWLRTCSYNATYKSKSQVLYIFIRVTIFNLVWCLSFSGLFSKVIQTDLKYAWMCVKSRLFRNRNAPNDSRHVVLGLRIISQPNVRHQLSSNRGSKKSDQNMLWSHRLNYLAHYIYIDHCIPLR